jgi:hypothetical protein
MTALATDRTGTHFGVGGGVCPRLILSSGFFHGAYFFRRGMGLIGSGKLRYCPIGRQGAGVHGILI